MLGAQPDPKAIDHLPEPDRLGDLPAVIASDQSEPAASRLSLVGDNLVATASRQARHFDAAAILVHKRLHAREHLAPGVPTGQRQGSPLSFGAEEALPLPGCVAAVPRSGVAGHYRGPLGLIGPEAGDLAER